MKHKRMEKADYAFIPHLQIKIRLVCALGVIAILLCISYFLLTQYSIKTVVVEGNKHYSAKEIQDLVVKGYFGDNSLYLSLKYKNKEITGIPFIETMDVNVLSKDTIKIMVYEKALAGYVEYLGRYMYFDNEGMIVEASKVTTSGIPQVTGLNFDHVILYEKLPVADESVFQNILTITKLLNKYDVDCDKIQFDNNYHVTLGYKKVKVYLGKLENLDEKVMQLPYILPELEGKSGTLDLQNYSSDKKTISFELDEG